MKLVDKHLNRLLEIVLGSSMLYSKVTFLQFVRLIANSLDQKGFSEASYSAVTTLILVSPSSVLPRIVEHLNGDINPDILNNISDHDLGVWATPEGTTFVDGGYFVFQ